MMRTSPRALFRALLVLAAGGALLACSRSAPPAATATDATPYAAVARGRIAIEGGLLALTMPREGTLASVDAHEGDRVKRGQVLAVLDTHPAELAVQAAQADVEQAKAQVQLADAKQAGARQRAERLTAAAAAGAGDGQSADDARDASAQARAERDAAQAAVDLAEQKLASAKYELAQRTLRAPVNATVVSVTAQPGASVSPSSGTVFTLLPDKPRIVRAELNESFVGAIKPGMAAQVVANDDAENGHWNAHVLRIGQVYGPATLENDPQIRANARTVECVLAFDQAQPQLRIGQRVIVRFLQAR
ncbi:MAG: HlyD family efflux transporter periplasmic adaptor subunit [Rhodanobacter sp.]|nr:MAG: HlyD family efflux transporter periplasmic adaptor subunit [Rhodanobacter sp.]TAM11050.1 MAG: HlyD family efflux transporter periplasmic adaptor subunit [Rhodanobacter sp.]TAM35551.1 MAG: HlyD family efflux transporter periplasmic adaptor subunit [Rhodanobacter sp.]